MTERTSPPVLPWDAPSGCKEHSRFVLAPQSEHRALKAKVWTPPVIAHGRLYCRLYLRDQDYLVCYHISLDATTSKSTNPRQP